MFLHPFWNLAVDGLLSRTLEIFDRLLSATPIVFSYSWTSPSLPLPIEPDPSKSFWEGCPHDWTYVPGAQHNWQEFVVGDMLHHGTDDFPRFLEKSVAIPRRIEPVQLQGDSVVFPHPDGVQGVQRWKQVEPHRLEPTATLCLHQKRARQE